MKTFALLTLISTAFSSLALADGFKCEAVDNSLRVAIYNYTRAEVGTRRAAVMILSDANVSLGRKTIARFKAFENLTSASSTFQGQVDPSNSDTSRAGELIGGTKLGELESVSVDVDFSYGAPLLAGELTKGTISLLKHNGEVIELALECERYLKN